MSDPFAVPTADNGQPPPANNAAQSTPSRKTTLLTIPEGAELSGMSTSPLYTNPLDTTQWPGYAPLTPSQNRSYEQLFEAPKSAQTPRTTYPLDRLDERREREFDRRERDLDRRERELERRERELERRQREFEGDKARWALDLHAVPLWQKAIEDLKAGLDLDYLRTMKKREEDLEERVMKKVGEVLEKERQMYGLMRMSDVEVNEMVEDTVGYLMQKDEDIADRVRFQSLLYLTQEKLASIADLTADISSSGSLSLAWRLALGPSVVTEDRYQKALELLKDKTLDETSSKLLACKPAMNYAVEYTSHLRKDIDGGSDISFAPGRIAKAAYLESVDRQVRQSGINREALVILVDFVCGQ